MNINELLKKHRTTASMNAAVSGKKVKIISNSIGQHGIPVGDTGTIIKYNGSPQAPYYGSFTVQGPASTGAPWTVYGSEFKFGESKLKDLQEEVKSIENEILESKKQIEVIQQKIAFMVDQGLEEYDEDTFKAFSILKMLDDKKLSNIDKAKLISTLVKS